MTEDAAVEMEDWSLPAIARFMNMLDFVRWDRMVRAPVPLEGWGDWQYVIAYGWIARADGRSDYVQLDFAPWVPGKVGAWSTSSARYSPVIAEIFGGPEARHNECERVEDVLGDLVACKISLRDVAGEPILTPREA